MFIAGIIGVTQNFANTCSHPIYLCKFDVVGSRNLIRRLFEISDKIPGASHGDDLGYIFDSNFIREVQINPSSLEDITIRRSIKFWTNFAKHGNPTPDQEEFNFKWKPVTKDALHYLHFGEKLRMKTNPEEDRMQVWCKVYNSHNDTKHFIPYVGQSISKL